MIVRDRITSYQNPRLRLARQLLDKKARRAEQRFVVDYGRDLARALQHSYRVDYVLVAPALLNDADATLLGDPALPIYEVSPDMLDKAGYRQHASGLVAVLHMPAQRLALPPPVDVLLLLVGLEKPGNIGALLRTADAASVGAVVLVDTALDRYNPNIIRASTGACFLPFIFEMTTEDALSFCRRQRYYIVSAHVQGDRSLFAVDFRQGAAVVLGAEDEGLPSRWRDACDILLRIPMTGSLTDSLNVSVAGAVILYEALRQRLSIE